MKMIAEHCHDDAADFTGMLCWDGIRVSMGEHARAERCGGEIRHGACSDCGKKYPAQRSREQLYRDEKGRWSLISHHAPKRNDRGDMTVLAATNRWLSQEQAAAWLSEHGLEAT